MYMKLGLSDQRIYELLTLSAFSRYPDRARKTNHDCDCWRKPRAGATSEAKREVHRQALEDMIWALGTSKEFLFNH